MTETYKIRRKKLINISFVLAGNESGRSAPLPQGSGNAEG